jgi:hypothetical protein
MSGGMPGMAQGTPNAFPPQPGVGPSGPQKTVLLQPTDGVVSVARAGGPVGAAPPAMQMQMPGGQVAQGASTLFWIVSLFTGVAIGVLAYVIVLQMS